MTHPEMAVQAAEGPAEWLGSIGKGRLRREIHSEDSRSVAMYIRSWYDVILEPNNITHTVL